MKVVGCLKNSQDRWPWIALVLFPGHLLFAAVTVGARPEHLVIDALFLVLAWSGKWGRKVSLGTLPIWLVAVAYENQIFLLPFRGSIHIGSLHSLELLFFGVPFEGHRQILADFFLRHTWPSVDLVTGFAYMTYLFEPMLLTLYFLWRAPVRAARLAWAFLLVNLMGIATYILLPAAPPWYVQQYGMGPAILTAPPSPAGAAAFDALVGIPYFASFYARSANVFGALPSLHAAYPVLCLLSVWGLGVSWLVGTSLFALLVGFSAVYLRHHYVIDVLMGWAYAGVAFAVVWQLVRRFAMVNPEGPSAAAIDDPAMQLTGEER